MLDLGSKSSLVGDLMKALYCFLQSLVLVQLRKTGKCPNMMEKLLTWTKHINTNKQTNKTSVMQIQVKPCHKKTCLQGLRSSKAQTSLLSYRDFLEYQNFAYRKLSYDSFQLTKAWMGRPVCVFVVYVKEKQVFSQSH